MAQIMPIEQAGKVRPTLFPNCWWRWVVVTDDKKC
jgi:hypothetical protein